jgi:hypothetical protein
VLLASPSTCERNPNAHARSKARETERARSAPVLLRKNEKGKTARKAAKTKKEERSQEEPLGKEACHHDTVRVCT